MTSHGTDVGTSPGVAAACRRRLSPPPVDQNREDTSVATTAPAGPVPEETSPRAASRRWREGSRELLLVSVLYAAYSLGRLVADDDLAAAASRASALLDLEGVLGLDLERAWSAWLASHEVLAVAASYWYSVAHYAVTPVVLLWLWWRRPASYARERWPLVLASAVALVVYVLAPVAPPRLVGYVDVLAQTSWAGWWSEHASAPAGLGHLTNELAAMPSLHVGWALWVALAVWRTTDRVPLRVLAALHPLVTSVVVVATGNHWVLDVAAGAALVLAADAVVAGWYAGRGRSARAGEPTDPVDWPHGGTSA